MSLIPGDIKARIGQRTTPGKPLPKNKKELPQPRADIRARGKEATGPKLAPHPRATLAATPEGCRRLALAKLIPGWQDAGKINASENPISLTRTTGDRRVRAALWHRNRS
jgi:hypothetical protein